ncbi:MAG TPA: hypothetical protein VH590_05195 [Ktedonobacterales bacterium]
MSKTAIPPRESRSKHPPRRAGWGWRLARGTRRGAARGFLRFWPLWERFTLWLWRVQPVPGSPRGLLQVSIHPHKGQPIILPDGINIARGEPIMELHFVNRLLSAREEGWQPFLFLAALADELRALADNYEKGIYPTSVRALFGVTLLARGAPRLGFTLRPRPRNLHGRLERFFLKGLLALYSSEGLARLARGSASRDLHPQEAWMSIETLLSRYGAQPLDTRPAHRSSSASPASADQTGRPTR